MPCADRARPPSPRRWSFALGGRVLPGGLACARTRATGSSAASAVRVFGIAIEALQIQAGRLSSHARSFRPDNAGRCMCLSAPNVERCDSPINASLSLPHLRRSCATATSARTVRLSGWCHRIRDHGGVLFIDLRDHYGLTQVVADPDSPAFKEAEKLRAGMGGADRRQGAQAPGRHRESPTCRPAQVEVYITRDRGAGPGRRTADAGVRRPGISGRHPAEVPLPRSAPRAAARQHHDARRR